MFSQELGEILIGLSYLPTAQRLSFNVVKATNLKYDAVTSEIDNFSNTNNCCTETGESRRR